MSQIIEQQFDMLDNEIVPYLKANLGELPSESSDGRSNSASGEFVVSECLKNGFGDRITVPKIRKPYDITIDECFTDIKISNFGTADNFNAKGGLAHCFTNMNWDEIVDHWIKYTTNLINRLQQKETHKDLFCLCINKFDIKDIYITSLRSLREVTWNASNFPFQVNWSKNRNRVKRTFLEARDFCLSNAMISLSKENRCRALDMMRESFPQNILNEFNEQLDGWDDANVGEIINANQTVNHE